MYSHVLYNYDVYRQSSLKFVACNYFLNTSTMLKCLSNFYQRHVQVHNEASCADRSKFS